MKLKLGFIGAGNMAGAILGGILGAHLLSPEDIFLSNRHENKLARFAEMGVHTTTENSAVADGADVIILAVKPQMFADVLPDLCGHVAEKCVISISPGYSVATLEKLLPGCHIVRAMPNTPLLVGKGVTAIATAPGVSQALFSAIVAVFSAAGAVTILPEEQLDAMISVTGSSPAYFFRMADAMVKGAVAQGFEPGEAQRLTALTMAGAADMLLNCDKTAQELTRQVCSPGGTTLAALTALDENHFDEMVGEAMARCTKRALELGVTEKPPLGK